MEHWRVFICLNPIACKSGCTRMPRVRDLVRFIVEEIFKFASKHCTVGRILTGSWELIQTVLHGKFLSTQIQRGFIGKDNLKPIPKVHLLRLLPSSKWLLVITEPRIVHLDENWLPTPIDVLMTRRRSTSKQETEFQYDNRPFRNRKL